MAYQLWACILSFSYYKGLSTRMRFKMRIQSESSRFAFNSNRARPHAMRIAIALLITLRSNRK